MIKFASLALGASMLVAGLTQSAPASAGAYIGVGVPPVVAIGAVPVRFHPRPYFFAPGPFYPAYLGWGYGFRGGYGYRAGWGYHGGWGYRGGYGAHGGYGYRGGAGCAHGGGVHLR